MDSLYHIQTLPQGIRLATAALPYAECATLSVYIPAGSRHDPANLAGLAHFMEHMVFKGTAKRSAKELTLTLENSGAQANACTAEDHTIYDARGDAASLPILADVLADMIWSSSLPPREILLERDVIHEEITMYEESPSEHIGDLISEALWAPHPLGNPITGTHKSLDAISRNDFFKFSQTHHFSPQVVIAAAGPYTHQQFADILMPFLPDEFSATPEPLHTFVRGRSNKPIIKHRETEQLQLALAFHTPGRRHATRHALRLLSILLGESASSRLFLNLREERGLCYHVSSDVALFEDTGSLEIISGLDPESRDEALEAIQSELNSLIHDGPSEAELSRAKNIATTAHKLALESTSAHMSWAGECAFFENEIISPTDSRKKLAPVTRQDIQELAALIFQENNMTMAEIRPL